ncbi:MAG: preprotein translocase subunit SecE [Clostridia bacterium]|nr:preprotein translocase subunit SecE [Clostridia bacterium]
MAKSTDKTTETEVKRGKEPEKKQKKQDKNKKPNIFVRMGRKLKETFSELKRVSWPTFGKALKATGVVLVIVLIFTVVVTGVNFGFGKLLELITKWDSKDSAAALLHFITRG